jgi:hypothetical protein
VSNPGRASSVTLARYRRALANRRAAGPKLATLLGEPRFRCASVGKGTPTELSQFLQAAIDGGLLPAGPSGVLTAEDCRNFMILVGIGIDCSGFVSQAINRLVDVFDDATPADRIRDVCNTPSAALAGDSTLFAKVNDARELSVGDTMWLEGHIRIVCSVLADGANIVFHTIESRAGKGNAERPGNIGPSRATYRLTPDPSAGANGFRGYRLERSSEPAASPPLWGTVSVRHVYGRYKPLTVLLERRGVRSLPLA